MNRAIGTGVTFAALALGSAAFGSDIYVDGAKYQLGTLNFQYSRVCFDGKAQFKFREGWAAVGVRTSDEPSKKLEFTIHDKDIAPLSDHRRLRYDEATKEYVPLSKGLPPLHLESRERPAWTAISMDDLVKEPYANTIKRDYGQVVSCDDPWANGKKSDGTSLWYDVERVKADLKKSR